MKLQGEYGKKSILYNTKKSKVIEKSGDGAE